MKKLTTLVFLSLAVMMAKGQNCIPNSSSLSFDGFSQHISFVSDNGLVITDSITVEAWINASQWATTSAQGTILCKHSWANGEQGYVLRAGGNGVLSFNIAGDSLGFPVSWREAMSPAGSMTTGTWYHVAGTFDGHSVIIYINGNPVASTSFTGKIIASTSYPAAIGMLSDQANAFLGRYWNGKIDEVRVWNYARSQAQIIAEMNHHINPAAQTGLAGYWRFNENSGTATADSSGNNNNGTLTSSSQWSSQVPFNGPPKPTATWNYPTLSSTPAYGYQWYFYNNPIPGATQQTYNPTQNGVYFVYVSDSAGCTTSSDPVPVLNAGVDAVFASTIKIHVSNEEHLLHVNSAGQFITSIEITDLSGRIVRKNKFNALQAELSLEEITTGIYPVKIYCGGTVWFRKIYIVN